MPFVKPIVKGMAGKLRQLFIDPRIAENLDYREIEIGQVTGFADDSMTP